MYYSSWQPSPHIQWRRRIYHLHLSSRSHSNSHRTCKQVPVRNAISGDPPSSQPPSLATSLLLPLRDSGGCLSYECAHYQKQHLFMGMKGPIPLVEISTLETTEPFKMGMGVYQFRMHMASARQCPAGWIGHRGKREVLRGGLRALPDYPAPPTTVKHVGPPVLRIGAASIRICRLSISKW